MKDNLMADMSIKQGSPLWQLVENYKSKAYLLRVAERELEQAQQRIANLNAELTEYEAAIKVLGEAI